MAASQLRCWECGTAFYGRADAHYCGGACRQKAHRARARSHGAVAEPTATRAAIIRSDIGHERSRWPSVARAAD